MESHCIKCFRFGPGRAYTQRYRPLAPDNRLTLSKLRILRGKLSCRSQTRRTCQFRSVETLLRQVPVSLCFRFDSPAIAAFSLRRSPVYNVHPAFLLHRRTGCPVRCEYIKAQDTVCCQQLFLLSCKFFICNALQAGRNSTLSFVHDTVSCFWRLG